MHNPLYVAAFFVALICLCLGIFKHITIRCKIKRLKIITERALIREDDRTFTWTFGVSAVAMAILCLPGDIGVPNDVIWPAIASMVISIGNLLYESIQFMLISMEADTWNNKDLDIDPATER